MHVEAHQGLAAAVDDDGTVRIGWGERDWFGPGRLAHPAAPSPGRVPAQPRSGSRRPAGGALQTPHGLDSGRVQGAGSGLTRGDHGVVEDGLHDGPLPGQVQRRPLSA